MPSSFRRSFNRAGGKMAQEVVGVGMKELLAQMLETPEVKEEKQLGLRTKRAQVKELEEPTPKKIAVPQKIQEEFLLPAEIDEKAAPFVSAYISFKKPRATSGGPKATTLMSKEMSDVLRIALGLPQGEQLTYGEVDAKLDAEPDKAVRAMWAIENQGLFLSKESKEQIKEMKEKYLERGIKKYKSVDEIIKDASLTPEQKRTIAKNQFPKEVE